METFTKQTRTKYLLYILGLILIIIGFYIKNKIPKNLECNLDYFIENLIAENFTLFGWLIIGFSTLYYILKKLSVNKIKQPLS